MAVVADVHGNRTALDAVVKDATAQGVDAWWALGDLVAIGPEPAATLELIADLPGVTVTRGNTERYVLTGDRPPPYAADVIADPTRFGIFAAVAGSFAWTRGALAATRWLDWLATLPLEVRTELPDGTRVLGVHATPGRDDGEGVTPDRPDEELAVELDGCDADVVLTGHTHQPTDRFIGSVRAVNGGSVSNPITDDRRAGYVIVHADRHGHRIEHRRVAYDTEAFLDAVRRSRHPEVEYITSFQRGEQCRFPAQRPGAPVVD